MSSTSLPSWDEDVSLIQPFIDQAVTAKQESVLCSIIVQVLSSSRIFFFGELLAIDSIKKVSICDIWLLINSYIG